MPIHSIGPGGQHSSLPGSTTQCILWWLETSSAASLLTAISLQMSLPAFQANPVMLQALEVSALKHCDLSQSQQAGQYAAQQLDSNSLPAEQYREVSSSGPNTRSFPTLGHDPFRIASKDPQRPPIGRQQPAASGTAAGGNQQRAAQPRPSPLSGMALP